VKHDDAAAVRAAELVKEHDVHTIECAFPDSWGALRGKRVPASQFANVARGGFALANAAFSWDPLCGIFELDFANAETGFPDMVCWPDPSTFRMLTWRDGTGLVMCDATDVHPADPVPLDPRHILRTATKMLADRGYTARVATELEFYLCDESWTPLYPDIQCYSITKGAELEHIMSDVRRKLEAFGIVVEASNTEYGPAQVEINVKYGSPLEVADNAALLKYAVKEIARQHGTRATFMSKPFVGFSGNGTHLHLSLWDAGGSNVFATNDLDSGFARNSLMRRCVAGLLAHQQELAAVASPTINAYKRFEDHSFAPTYVNWGGDNRGVAIRCVTDHGNATRIEVRTGSADANPHILIAGQIAAICDALDKDHELPPMCAGNAYAPQDRPLMPRTLQDSIEAFRAGGMMRRAFGDVYANNTISLLQNEVDEFGRQVTEWEKTRYMEVS
jgi:glutamine synthetase